MRMSYLCKIAQKGGFAKDAEKLKSKLALAGIRMEALVSSNFRT